MTKGDATRLIQSPIMVETVMLMIPYGYMNQQVAFWQMVSAVDTIESRSWTLDDKRYSHGIHPQHSIA